MTKYTAIGFDWGGVIEGEPAQKFTAGAAAVLGVSVDTYLEAYYRHNHLFNLGDGGWSAVAEAVCNDLDQPDKCGALMAYAQADFHERKINQSMLALVDKLRTNGYKVGLFSNNTKEKAVVIREQGYDKHFDVTYVSAEVGYMKPDPNGFRALASALGCDSPQQMAFVDDSAKSLSTAQEVGFTPLLFTDIATLLDDLRSLGIKTD